MKKNQIKELRSKSEKELEKMRLDYKSDMVKIMLDLKSKKLRNTALVVNKKKAIAQILTIMHEKEMVKS